MHVQLYTVIVERKKGPAYKDTCFHPKTLKSDHFAKKKKKKHGACSLAQKEKRKRTKITGKNSNFNIGNSYLFKGNSL